MTSNQPSSDPARENLLQIKYTSSAPEVHQEQATLKTAKMQPHSASVELATSEHSSPVKHITPKTTKNQPLRITTSEQHMPLLKKHFGSRAIAHETLCITPSPSPISPSVSHASQSPSPCIQPTIYFNFEMMESHYTRDETCKSCIMQMIF